MRKFITVAEMRDLGHQLYFEQITYSRMIDILNEKAKKWAKEWAKENDKVIPYDNGKQFIVV
jgi:hypothetical protein